MVDINRFLPRYLGVFSSYLLADDDLARERALAEASEVGKATLVDGPALDQIVELHGNAQRRLARRWEAAQVGSPERDGMRRLAAGDATPLLLALMLAHELAQQALHERRWLQEHDQGKALFEQTDDLMLLLGPQGRLESVNPAFTRHTGWNALEAGDHVEALFGGSPTRSATRILRRQQARRDGSSFTVEWSVSPIFARSGELLSHVCIGRDVSQQQQVADGLRENDKLRAVATLAGGVAHDFNNLLGAINGLAELCELQAEPGSRMARNLGRIRQACDKAAALVRQMLDFSRQAPRAPKPLLASELLAHGVDLMRAVLPPAVTLTVRIDVDGTVMADLVQMEQVLLNLTRNAAQAMDDDGGEIEIVVDRADPARMPETTGASAAGGTPSPVPRHLRLRVRDDGCGMAPELLAHIFDPFYTTKPVGEGTGLGLAAAQGIVASHGGEIEVTSKPGVGTTFGVFLPLVVAQVSPLDADSELKGAADSLDPGARASIPNFTEAEPR